MMRNGDHTPWGPAQDVHPIGPTVDLVTTAGHGGLRITGEAFNAIPDTFWKLAFAGQGWAEEDCELPIIAAILHKAGHLDADVVPDVDRLYRHARWMAEHSAAHYRDMLPHLPEAQPEPAEQPLLYLAAPVTHPADAQRRIA